MIVFAKVFAVGAVALASTATFAFPTFFPGTNRMLFDAFENQYRLASDASCATPGTTALDACLPFDARTDPAGALYLRVNPLFAGPTSVKQGDIFAGVFRVANIQPGGLPNQSSAAEQFTGYFAQEVSSISLLGPVLDPFSSVAIFFTATTADPFGILTRPGEMFSLFTQVPGVFDPTAGGTAASQVVAATAGTYFGSLGLAAQNGYAYTEDNLNIAGANSVNIQSYLALDFILPNGPSYNAGQLNKVNDESEATVGGVTNSGVLTCDATDLASATISCADVVGSITINRNSQFGTTASNNSPFYYQASNPLFLNAVPEPGSLALIGLALAGLGLVRRRKAV